MHVLPVIDLLGGAVVRGVAGERHAYRPIASRIARDASPAAIARGLVDAFGFAEVYVADLDAIAGRPPAWNDYAAIRAADLRLWVDAGIGDTRHLRRLIDASESETVHRWIAGLESLTDAAALNAMVEVASPERFVFSLDLKHGRPVTPIAAWKEMSPVEIATQAYAAGVRRMIVLDLARVGLGQGSGTGELCRALRSRWPDVELIGGGGVSCAADLEQLATDGLDAALVASALHDGRLTRSDVKS